MAKELHIDDFDQLLVVEGWSDLHFYAEALEHLGVVGKVFIQECGGVSKLKQKLRSLLSPELLADKRSIAVILDADSDASNQIQAIKARLLVMDGLKDRTLVDNGWSTGQPNIGFFIVPDGSQPGEIETLAWNAWANDPKNAEVKPCVEGFLDCMKQQKRLPKKHHKGLVSALLAIENTEDPRLGPGAQANVFDFTRPEFEPLLKFLRGFAG